MQYEPPEGERAPWEDPNDGDCEFLPEANEWNAEMENDAGPEYHLKPDPDPRKKRKRKEDDGGQEQ